MGSGGERNEAAAEYRDAIERAAWFERGDRGVIRVTGEERRAWLHNLVTNDVRGLADDAGCYAFALDVRGRILFDMNVLALGDALWLDLDAGAVDKALGHLDRYLLSEDARLEDRTAEFTRLGCAGPRAGETAERLNFAAFADLPALGVRVFGDDGIFFRHDFAGLPGFELTVPRRLGDEWRGRLSDAGARAANLDTLDVLRIEAGIPWWGRELDESVLPAETGQVSRGVSYTKGCYLGQEIVERMRSRGSVSRRLARLTLTDGAGVELPSPLVQAGVEVGRVTSLARNPLSGRWVGLGFLKARVTEFSGITIVNHEAKVEIWEIG